MAHQIAAGRLAAGSDRLGHGRAEVAHEGDRRAESVEGGLDGGAQCGRILGMDADGVQHPAAPAVQAQEQPAPAPVAGGVGVQGVAVRHGGPQSRGALQVQLSQQLPEAVAEHGTRSVPRGRWSARRAGRGSPRAGAGGGIAASRPTRSDRSRNAARGAPGRPVAGSLGAVRDSAGSGGGSSRARTVPVASVDRTRVWLLRLRRPLPQAGHRRASAGKSGSGQSAGPCRARATRSGGQPGASACARSVISSSQAPLFGRPPRGRSG